MHTLTLPIESPSFFPYKGELTSVNLSKPEREIQNNVAHLLSVIQFIIGQTPDWKNDVSYIKGVQIVKNDGKFWLSIKPLSLPLVRLYIL